MSVSYSEIQKPDNILSGLDWRMEEAGTQVMTDRLGWR